MSDVRLLLKMMLSFLSELLLSTFVLHILSGSVSRLTPLINMIVEDGLK